MWLTQNNGDVLEDFNANSTVTQPCISPGAINGTSELRALATNIVKDVQSIVCVVFYRGRGSCRSPATLEIRDEPATGPESRGMYIHQIMCKTMKWLPC